MSYKALLWFYVIMIIGVSVAGTIATTKVEHAFILGLPMILAVLMLAFILAKWRRNGK